METRGCKSKQAKLALIENELGNYVKYDEVEVHQEEEKNKAFPVIFFNAKTHKLEFEETFLKCLKRRVEDKINCLGMENEHLMKENKSNEIKLVQILEEFNKFVYNLNQSNIELEETKRNLDKAKATMIKTNSELDATNAELNCKIEQLHKKEEELSSTKEDLAINKNKLSTAHKNIACTREELIQGKIDFNILKHDYETTMEALKSTNVDLKNANDELTSSKVELIKTKNAFSAKFDNILAKAEDLSIKKEVLEINHKYCDTNLRDQIDQTECLKVESKEKSKIIESFRVSEDKSNGKILDLKSIIIAKDIMVDKLDMNIKYIQKDIVESMTNLQKQIAEQEKAKN